MALQSSPFGSPTPRAAWAKLDTERATCRPARRRKMKRAVPLRSEDGWGTKNNQDLKMKSCLYIFVDIDKPRPVYSLMFLVDLRMGSPALMQLP